MKSIVLLSGGLDSVVSMLMADKHTKIELAITFDYGQRARNEEIKASRNIASLYGIKHRIIDLPFMLETGAQLISNNDEEISSAWVPNRNGLFINIAACFAETLLVDYIVCGFNREEALIFPDNSAEFVDAINHTLSYSTKNKVIVKSYIQDMDKVDIIKQAVKLGLDFNLLWSCYQSGNNPCGKCSSCLTNKKAFEKVGLKYAENFNG